MAAEDNQAGVQELAQRLAQQEQELAQLRAELKAQVEERQLIARQLATSESRLRGILEAMTDVVLVIHVDCTQIDEIEIAPTHLSTLYDAELDWINETVAAFFAPATAGHWFAIVERVLRQQQGTDFDYRLTLSGEEIWFSARISPLDQKTVIWVARDIRDRKEAETQLQQKNQLLERTLKELQLMQNELIQAEKMSALGQLVASIAHEINTPLGIISSSGRVLEMFWQESFGKLLSIWQGYPPDQQTQLLTLLEEIHPPTPLLSTREQRQLRRQLTQDLEALGIGEAALVARICSEIGLREPPLALMTQMPDLAWLEWIYQLVTMRISTHNIAIATDRAAKIVFALKRYAHSDQSGVRSPLDVESSLETVLTLYQNQIKQGVTVERDYTPNLPPLLGYPDELHQVWGNLIHNALQAMQNRGVLRIITRSTPTAIQVTITDSGPGIPGDILPQIFQPFFTTKVAGEGSGLGLDIVRKIVDRHKGEITVTSEPGCTTFTVCLPLGEK
ncbi:ATP-binding protein [Spirulina sp. CCNP1310]|uniref:sensor histidine kinase n=1 Tax=Spirulina sp. CCNP1310 TaxID=3110249 RepID=UPI002B216AFB|nr:ATP-binding protein [Spirulina sp. CCNP1310]MEA5420256.1 ATP-binding protein [Spirulina sp. CCNP1310]